MMLRHASVIAFIAIIRLTGSQELDLLESLASIDFKYWPLDDNDTSASWISLDGMRIQTMSSVFRVNAPDLRWLVMDNNAISTIPSEAFNFFPDLTWISLAENQISRFASNAFRGLDHLQVLNLDGNAISEDHSDTSVFGTLPALERLYLRNCGLQSFDLPENMGNLTHLFLSHNYLKLFNTSSKSALTHLSINNNKLIYVSLSHFDSLVYLNLSSNWLGSIDYHSPIPNLRYYKRLYDYQENSESALSLADTPLLQYLIVSFNKISKISPYIFDGRKELIHVDLSGNLLTELKAGRFRNLPHLENVLLDSNRLKKINYRAFANLPKLKTISLKNNYISDVDQDAFSKVGSNADGIQLLLDNNDIHTLKRGSFSGLKSLQHIGLSQNRIKTISSQAFVNLPNLKRLVIENQLHDESSVTSSDIFEWQPTQGPILSKGIIESDAFYNLTSLYSIEIRGNSLANIEAQAFHALPALKILDLSDNKVEYLSALAFSDLPSVDDLYLEDNLISKIEPETFPKQLKWLNLARNPLCQKFSCWNIEELDQLEKLDVSGIIEQFIVDEVAALPLNLTVIFGKSKATPK